MTSLTQITLINLETRISIGTVIRCQRNKKWTLFLILSAICLLIPYVFKDTRKQENKPFEPKVQEEDAVELRESLGDYMIEQTETTAANNDNDTSGKHRVQDTYSFQETTPKRVYTDERKPDLSSISIDYSKITINNFIVSGYSFDLLFYDDICEYYSSIPRYFLYEHEIQNYLEDNYNKEFISIIVSEINDMFKEYGYSDAALLSWWVKFVQSIPYEYDKEDVSYDDWSKYPIETLYHNSGDCEDHAILLLSILKELNYDCAAILLPGHVAVGLAAENIDGSYYNLDGVKYYYIETTNYWDIGDIPDDYKDTSARLVVIE